MYIPQSTLPYETCTRPGCQCKHVTSVWLMLLDPAASAALSSKKHVDIFAVDMVCLEVGMPCGYIVNQVGSQASLCKCIGIALVAYGNLT